MGARQLAQLRFNSLLRSQRSSPFAASVRIPRQNRVMEFNQNMAELARAQPLGRVEVEVEDHDPLKYMTRGELIDIIKFKERQEIQLQADVGALRTQFENNLDVARNNLAVAYRDVRRNNAGWNEAFNRAEVVSHELARAGGMIRGLMNEVNDLHVQLRESRDQTDQACAELVDLGIEARDLGREVESLQREVDVKEAELNTRAPITAEQYKLIQQMIDDLRPHVGEAHEAHASPIQDAETLETAKERIQYLEWEIEKKRELVRGAYAAINDARDAVAKEIVEEEVEAQSIVAHASWDGEVVHFANEGEGGYGSESPSSSTFDGFSESSRSPTSESSSAELQDEESPSLSSPSECPGKWTPGSSRYPCELSSPSELSVSSGSEEEDGSGSLERCLISPQWHPNSPIFSPEPESQVSETEEPASSTSPEYHPNSPVFSPPEESQIPFGGEDEFALPLPETGDDDDRDQTESVSTCTARDDSPSPFPESLVGNVSERQSNPHSPDQAVAVSQMRKRSREEFEREEGVAAEEEHASKRRYSENRVQEERSTWLE